MPQDPDAAQGSPHAAGGIDISASYQWVGGYNYNHCNPQPGGLNGQLRISGTVDPPGGTDLQSLLIFDHLNAGTAESANALNIIHIAQGETMTGGRATLALNLDVRGPTGNTGGGQYSACTFYAVGSGPDGWVSPTQASTLYGGNSVAALHNGATNWAGVFGWEFDVGVGEGCYANAVYGISVVLLHNHAVNGVTTQAVNIGCQAGPVRWSTGIGFGGPMTPWPFDAASTLIRACAGPIDDGTPAATGIDFSEVAFSGNAFISSGATVDGTGRASFRAVTTALLTSAEQMTIASGADADIRLATAGGTVATFCNSGTVDLANSLLVAAGDALCIGVGGESSGGMRLCSGDGPLLLNYFGAQDVVLGSGALTKTSTAGFPCAPLLRELPSAMPSRTPPNMAPWVFTQVGGTYGIAAYIDGGWRHAAIT